MRADRADPQLAKAAIQKHIGKLVMKPKQTPEGPVFEVAGDIDLFAGDSSVMLNNPVGGIAQHYIPFLVPFGPLVLAAGPTHPRAALRPFVVVGITVGVFLNALQYCLGTKPHDDFGVFPMPLTVTHRNLFREYLGLHPAFVTARIR